MRLLLAFLVFVLIFLFGCTQYQPFVENEIEKANYCEVKEDCAIIEGQCPFGCFIGVNKEKASSIQDLVDSYHSNCIYECIGYEGVECENNKCVIKYPGYS